MGLHPAGARPSSRECVGGRTRARDSSAILAEETASIGAAAMSAEGSVSLATPELVHVWHRCHACNAQPIRGTRFDCQDCPVGPESTFCERCYVSFTHGSVP